MMSATARALERPTGLPTSLMIRYGVGQIGAQVFRDTPAVLLPIFMITMLGVPAWMAGIAILIPKAWIVFADTLTGSLFDRRKYSWGRLPFLAVGALATGVGMFVLFRPIDFSSAVGSAIYVAGIYLVTSTGFSVYTVPYLALAAELAASYHERTTLFAYRIGFTMVGIVIGVGVAQPLIGWFGGGKSGWSGMATVLALICFTTMFAPVLGLRRTRFDADRKADTCHVAPAYFKQLRACVQNEPFVVLIATRFLQSIGQACSYSAVGLVFIYVLQNVALLLPFVLVMAVTSLGGQPLLLGYARRVGKKTALITWVLAWCAVTLSWLLVTPDAHGILTLPLIGVLTTQHVLALLRSSLIGLVNSGFELMSFSLLADTIAYDRTRFARSSEGIFSGIYSATEKLAYAIGPAIAGIVLSLSGFAASKGGAIAQSGAAVRGVLLNYSVIPVVIFLVSLMILRNYRLTESDLAERIPAEPAAH